MSIFKTTLYFIVEGEEVEIECTVDYDAVYQPAQISGPPERCYPEESEMTINSVLPDDPEISPELKEAIKSAEDRIIDEAWEDYHSRGVDDGPEPEPEDRD
jgi:hypothetical protein